MSYLQPLITLSFWFNGNPPPLLYPIFIGLGVLIILLFLEGGVTKWLSWKQRKNPPLHRVLSRWGRAALTIAAIGAVLFFFTFEQIPFVSARFWWGLLLIGGIVWKVFIIKDIRKRYPAEKSAMVERLAKEKYLPK
jgi:hypothetical protein